MEAAVNYLNVLDLRIFTYLYKFSAQIDYLDLLLAYLAEGLPYIIVGSFVLVFIIFRRNKDLIYAFLAGLGSWLFSSQVLKDLINRPRPFEILRIPTILFETDAAFPSGHASFMFGLAFYLIFSGNKKLGAFCIFLAVLNGLSRVILGLHWLIDIIGGALVGLFGGYILFRIKEKYLAKIIS